LEGFKTLLKSFIPGFKCEDEEGFPPTAAHMLSSLFCKLPQVLVHGKIRGE